MMDMDSRQNDYLLAPVPETIPTHLNPASCYTLKLTMLFLFLTLIGAWLSRSYVFFSTLQGYIYFLKCTRSLSS